jgi:trk system potassium uptake protein
MSKIHLNAILKIAGGVLLIESISYLLCIPVALIYSESILPFVWSILATIIPGLLLFLFVPRSIKEELSNKEGYISVTMAWIVLTICGTLPYLFSHVTNDFISAIFESASGYTTTGATIFSDVELLPYSILFWRSLTHWIGGIGIIVLVIIILPTLKVGGYNLFSLEFSIKEKILPKTKSIAKTIVLIYLALTIAEIIFLVAGKMKFFDSVCITFGTVATGGFSVRNTSLESYSPYLQYVVTAFMFLSATSYVVLFFLYKRNFKKVRANDEFLFYFLVTILAISFITVLLLFKTDRDFNTSLRHAAFQVVAQITTTGFATTDYMAWPKTGWFFMFLLLFAGGCTGSTTGGIKMAKHLLSLKNMKGLLIKLQHPNAVYPIKLNGRMVPENINYTMILFVFIYIITFVIGAFIISITGVPVNEALGGSASALANVGPGLGASGNMGNFSAFNHASKLTMSVLMIVGRLEIFTVLAIFTKSFWRG